MGTHTNRRRFESGACTATFRLALVPTKPGYQRQGKTYDKNIEFFLNPQLQYCS